MYAQHFGLHKEPFSIAPDPHFLFMSEQHREALALLLYGVGGGGGFVLLTGEIGAGKTTVCRCFLEQIPAQCDVAYIFNPKLSALELLQTICEEFGVPLPESAGPAPTAKVFVDALNRYLLEAHSKGRNAVLIIDEAQSLAPEVLEQLRLLTNLETAQRKLLQIILIGQPELRQMLADPGLEQLAQRVIARYHLGALSAPETAHYVNHRIAVAGGNGIGLSFDEGALLRLHQLTRGVPRRINLLAARTLLGAYARGVARVDKGMVDVAAKEVFGELPSGAAGPGLGLAQWGHVGWRRLGLAASAIAALAVLGAGAWLAWYGRASVPTQQPSAGVAGSTGPSELSGSSALPPFGPGPATVAAPVSAVQADGRPVASASPSASGASAAGGPDAQATLPTQQAPASHAVEPGAVLAAAWASEAEAMQALASLWPSLNKGGAFADRPCGPNNQAQWGVACFRSKGGMALLKQMGRPAVLFLRLRDEAPVYVLLERLDEREATLRAGTRRWRVPLAVLANLWPGEFVSLWKPPPGWREAGSADASNQAAVRTWLHRQLAMAGGDQANQALRERVAAFQVAHGLPGDGRAGPVTLMQLNRVAGVDEPRWLAAD